MDRLQERMAAPPANTARHAAEAGDLEIEPEEVAAE
jgi:hypothetical protein